MERGKSFSIARNVSDKSSHNAHFLSAYQINIHLVQGARPLKDTREQIKKHK